MNPFEDDVKKAVAVANKFLSVTLAREPLSPDAEKERSLLAGWFKKLKIQLGASTESTEDIKPPPRPAKGRPPVTIPAADEGQDQGSEDIYDDVKDDDKVQDEYYSEMAEGVEEGPGNASQNATEPEDYEAMDKDEVPGVQTQDNIPVQNYEIMDNGCNQESQENYEEPQQNQINEDYEISGDQLAQVEQNYEVADTTTEQNYEVADPAASTGNETGEGVETYEGIDGPEQTPGEGLRDSSTLSKSTDWKHLTKNVKPGEIEGVIIKGTLWKHRKEGKFFVGSKWQKRFCVLRSSVLYYFKDKSSDKQQGQVLLPGYKVETVDKSGREFKLTIEGGRSFKFNASSKAEAQKWMAAIQNVADVPMSARHSVTLQEIRDNEPSGDDDSMSYEDVSTSGTTPAAETTTTAAPLGRTAGSDEAEELYDDTLAENEAENFYEAVGSVQSTVAARQGSSTPIEKINYEISATQASGPTEPVEEENYELPEEQNAPALPPPRPSKPHPQPGGGENARIAEDKGSPAPSPLRPSKGQPEPEQEENYEVPEEQRSPSSPPPRPTKPKVVEETYEIAEEQRQPTPSAPRQHRPPPEPIQDENYEVPEQQEAALPAPPRPTKPQPLVPDEEYEVPGQDEALPPPPPSLLIEENYEVPEEKPAAPPRPTAAKRKPPAPQPKEIIPEQPKRPAPSRPQGEPKNFGLEQNAINYGNVYQALWNCEQDDDDELPFQRGDLIYIYEKPHSDWWIGSLFKPQGDRVGLVPSQYVMEAYA